MNECVNLKKVERKIDNIYLRKSKEKGKKKQGIKERVDITQKIIHRIYTNNIGIYI